MTKKSEQTSPATPASEERDRLTKNNSLAEVKKFSRWKTVEDELHELKDGKVQLYLIGDGVPYAFWTHAYQNLEMAKNHAGVVRKRLVEEKHIIRVSISELKQFYPGVHAACTANYISNFYYFLTDEGYNRMILEINTSGMKDKEIAARIDRRKDEIAEVFTKYRRGELIPVNAPPAIDKIEEKRKNGTGLTDQVKKWVTKRIVPRYISTGKNIHKAYSTEFTKINEITAGYHERDLKNKLNSTGLDIQNATKLADVTCLKVGVVDDEIRWKNVEEIIDDMYPDRFEDQIRLNEREMALIKRGCTKDQKSLFEFRQTKQIAGGSP
jgi:hypothetical protein